MLLLSYNSQCIEAKLHTNPKTFLVLGRGKSCWSPSTVAFSLKIAEPVARNVDPPKRVDMPILLALGAISVGVVLGVQTYLMPLKQKARGESSMRVLDPTLSPLLNVDESNSQYRMALARTRQAVAVHRAIASMNAGNVSRTMVEIRRALHENSMCRAPLLNNEWSRADRVALYRVHVQNTSVPPDFATSLQLRTLLDIDFDDAENIEREIMEQGSAYSI